MRPKEYGRKGEGRRKKGEGGSGVRTILSVAPERATPRPAFGRVHRLMERIVRPPRILLLRERTQKRPKPRSERLPGARSARDRRRQPAHTFCEDVGWRKKRDDEVSLVGEVEEIAGMDDDTVAGEQLE